MQIRKLGKRLGALLLVLTLAVGLFWILATARRDLPQTLLPTEPEPLIPEAMAVESGSLPQLETEPPQPTQPEQPSEPTEPDPTPQPTPTESTSEHPTAPTSPTAETSTDQGDPVPEPTETTQPSQAPSGGDEDGPHGDDPDVEPTEKPHIVTDLTSCTLTPDDLTDDTLEFYAYAAGAERLSLKVYWKTKGSNENNGTLLHADPDQRFRQKLTLNENYIVTIYLYQDGKRYGQPAVFYITYRARLADPDHPQVGDQPPIITTNRDGIDDPVKTQTFTLVVTARTGDGKTPIYANHLQVYLDGSLLTNPTGGAGSGYEYLLQFQPPQDGDSRKYTVSILAWDDNGNSSWRSLDITYETVSEGDHLGYASVAIDATTVGLGIIDYETYEIVQGETAAQTVLKMLEDCGFYQVDYSGVPTKNGGFYLMRLHRGDLLRSARVDDHLWELIQRDGISLTAAPDRDSLGEHDYTWGSGWMYDVNGYYPGKGLSDWYLADGDVLTLRFTLAWGKDINGFGSTGGSYGTLSSYCGIWRDGSFIPLSHDYHETDRKEPTGEEEGYVEQTCSKCGNTQREIIPKLPTEQPTEPPEPPDEEDPEEEETP